MGLVALLLTTALIVVVLGLYWLPSIVACLRRSPNLSSVVVVNALLGWTVVGWFIALAKVIGSAGACATP